MQELTVPFRPSLIHDSAAPLLTDEKKGIEYKLNPYDHLSKIS